MNGDLQPLLPSELLRGVTVVELSSGVAGAYCGKLLASLGAEVHRHGPRLDVFVGADSEADVIRWLHDGKVLHPRLDGPELVDLVAAAHLLVVEDLGLDPDLTEVIRRAEASAAGPTQGAHVLRLTASTVDGQVVPGSGLTSSGWSGVSWVLGEPDRVPLSLPFDLADYQAALQGAAAGLAMLVGTAGNSWWEPRVVEVAARDVLAYYTGMITANFLPYERPWHRSGVRPAGSAGVYPIGQFRCRDGWIAILIRSQPEWDGLVRAMGNPAWCQDPRFADPRVIARFHADEADEHLLPWIQAHTQQELYELGARHGLAIAPLRELPTALDEPQLASREFLRMQPSDAGELRVPGAPWQIREVAPTTTAPRPWPLTGPRAEGRALFSGLRVLDLSWVWSGPMTTSALADLGAEVLKIEHAGHLDTGRLRGRARRNGLEVEGPEHDTTPYFNQMNHGKRSITIDTKTEQGRELVLRLAETCDVVVENMRPGALQKLGLSYDDLAARNPSIVMLSMSMAGQQGPLSGLKGYAGVMSALSGMDALVGYDSEAVVGTGSTSLGDPNAAGHALTVMLAALHRRARTGRGAWIDLSQVEASFSVLGGPIIESQRGGKVPVPANRHPRHAPHGHFTTNGDERWIALAVRNDAEWTRLVAVAGTGLDRPAWKTAQGRLADVEALEVALDAWTRAADRDELVTELLAAGVPAAPVASYEDLAASSWKASQHLAFDVEHRYLGTTHVFVVPWKFDGAALGIQEPGPLLGQHTEEVLTRILGLTDAEIDEHKRNGILR